MTLFKEIFYQNDVPISCLARQDLLPFPSVLFPRFCNEMLPTIRQWNKSYQNLPYVNILCTFGQQSERVYMKVLHVFLRAAQRSVAKCLSEAE